MSTRVAFAKCPDYHPENVSRAVDFLLSELGGLEKFVPPGATVMLKPNLLTGRSPEEAVTTHPEVVRTLVRRVRQCGGKPFIGDSPSGPVKIESVVEKTGIGALCRKEQVNFVTLEKELCVPHNYRGIALAISKPALDADLLINVSKLKTHSFAVFTNAVKNVFGLLPGYQKALLHKAFPTPRLFGGCLAFLYSIIKPELTVCDAVVAMEGDGPAGGTTRRLGFLAASADGIALDTAVCHLLKLDPREVKYFENLKEMRIGEMNLNNIELTGDYTRIKELVPLRLPGTARVSRYIPDLLVRLLDPLLWVGPAFNEKCTACGRCVQTCPVQALIFRSKNRPFLDGKKCIGCCCCHEVCPEGAIKMTCSPLLRLTSFGRSMRSQNTQMTKKG